jgi:lipopolysaccharide/colanic/teichoic acid biosynthesis glycosyltransferase
MDGTRIHTPAPGTRRRRVDVAAPRIGGTGAGAYAPLKACLEWFAALLLLIASLPLLALVAWAIKSSSPGPVLYSQVRLGRGAKPFRIYKLRTMTHRCEATTGPVWSLADDPRVTGVGRWLRDTHLDELPQLWNVLRGEMSLIGPRPERPEIAAKIERAIPRFAERLRVRPGITGLAQMRLPADSGIDTVAEKLAHDLAYVRRLGPGLDARIVASTLLHFAGWGATVASRRLVRPFAPSRAATPTVLSDSTDLPVSGKRGDSAFGTSGWSQAA